MSFFFCPNFCWKFEFSPMPFTSGVFPKSRSLKVYSSSFPPYFSYKSPQDLPHNSQSTCVLLWLCQGVLNNLSQNLCNLSSCKDKINACMKINVMRGGPPTWEFNEVGRGGWESSHETGHSWGWPTKWAPFQSERPVGKGNVPCKGNGVVQSSGQDSSAHSMKNGSSRNGGRQLQGGKGAVRNGTGGVTEPRILKPWMKNLH